MKRRISTFLMILASLLALSLAACDMNEVTDTEEQSSAEESTSAEEQSSSEVQTVYLEKPQNVTVDENGTLTWSSVENASGYTVKVTDPDGKETAASLGANETSFSCSYSDAGSYTLSIQANSSEANIIASDFSDTVTVNRLVSPEIEHIESDPDDISSGFTLTLKDGLHAVSYELYLGDEMIGESDSLSFSVTDFRDESIKDGQTFAFKVVAKGENTENAVTLPSECSFNITVLPSPEILDIKDHLLSFSEIDGNAGYRVTVNADAFDISESKYDLGYIEAGEYSISVYAKGDGEYILPSFSSPSLTVIRLEAPTDVTISLAKPRSITLKPVKNATGYHMIVDGDGEKVSLGTVEDVRVYIKDLGVTARVYSSADYFNDDRTIYYMESKNFSIAAFSGFGSFIANKVMSDLDSMGITYSKEEIEAIAKDHNEKFYPNNEVPAFYKDHVIEVEKKINDKLALIENGDAFVFTTDVHIHSNKMASVPLIKHIAQNTSVDKTFCGGDLLGAYSTPGKTNSKEKGLFEGIATLSLMSQIKQDADFYYVRGNHDFTVRDIQADNKTRYDTGYTLPYAETVDLVMPYQSSGAVVPDDEALYFYVDNAEQKVRYIVVDTHTRNHASEETYWGVYSGLDPEQKDWLINTALSFEDGEGWSVVIFGHIPCVEEQNSYSSNLKTLGDIIKDFNNKRAGAEWDFTDSKAEFVAYICGHNHIDEHVYVDNTLFISTGSSAKYKDDVWERPANDVGQDLFDVFVIDKDNKTLTAIRVGAGEDREFNY